MQKAKSDRVNRDAIWANANTTRVPFEVYKDGNVYANEMEKIFYGATWNYVGLESEIPKVGDFRRNFIGEREVLMIRKKDGLISVIENFTVNSTSRAAPRAESR